MRILLAAALIAAAPFAAQAQEPQAHQNHPAAAPGTARTGDQPEHQAHGGMGSMGMEIGADGLTRDEFLARHGAMFARMDANGDGRLTREEFAAHRAMMHGSGGSGEHTGMTPGGMPSMGMEIGENGLNRDEFAARHLAMFARMDANADGRVTREEFAAHRAAMGGAGGSMGMRMAREIDEDGLTRDEFLARHNGMFARIDANGDGRISREEFATHRAAMMNGGSADKDDAAH